MPKSRSFHFHAAERMREAMAPSDFSPMTALQGLEAVEVDPQLHAALAGKSFNNDESAARHYMNAMWVQEQEGPLFEITAPESPEVVPNLRFGTTQDSPATSTHLLHFNQTANNLPILGSKAVVELNLNRELVSIDAKISDDPQVSPIATLSPADALGRVAEKIGVTVTDLGSIPPPALTYYHHQDESWHLVYEVKRIPFAPPEFRQALDSEEGHGLGPSPQRELLEMTYLIDAHDGSVLLYYTESPWLVDLPCSCTGLDEMNTQQTFFGFQNNGGAIELRDPIRNLRTLDFQFGNLAKDPPPTLSVTNASFDFAGTSTAAVSAHVNAMRVYDFFNDVLKRDSVDDKGMELISVVNCTYQPPGAKDWKNAVWYQKRMWYGQVQNAGTFSSYSRHLDVIGHELTHGVTESTAALKYLNESGALSESFSDICGIIIKNIYGPDPDDVSKWSWEIGSGLGKNGGPLRDLSDPKRTGQPDHMSDYKILPIWQDSGGVHTNSNIHNKAAYNVLTAKDAGGNFIFAPKQAALLYYLTLTRLSSFATFIDVLSTLQNVIRTFWAGRPVESQLRLDAVVAAYDGVGVKSPPTP